MTPCSGVREQSGVTPCRGVVAAEVPPCGGVEAAGVTPCPGSGSSQGAPVPVSVNRYEKVVTHEVG